MSVTRESIVEMKKRFKAEERKKQILNSAIKVFARSNYMRAGIAEIAADVGVSEAAIYRYFPSKKAIFLEILRQISDDINMFWQMEFNSEDDALKLLRAMGEKYYRYMLTHSNESRVHFQAISEMNDGDIAERLRKNYESYRKIFVKIVKKGIQQGSIRKDLDINCMAWVFNCMGITLNTTHLLSFQKDFDEKRISRIMNHLSKSITA